jgi:pimeloyl-ACP methyl ester carboxylesterase
MFWEQPSEPPVPFEAEGSGAPVLMIHGRHNDGQLWAPVAAILSGRFRTIRCNLREGVPAYRTVDQVSRLEALLRWLDLPRVHVVSHGAGWSQAADLATRAPVRVASLTVVDPIIPRAEQNNTVQESWHLEMLLQWLAVSNGNVVRQPQHAAALAAVVAQQTHSRMAEAEPDPHLAPAMATELPPLDGIRCPLLALVGQQATGESKALVASVFGQVRQMHLSHVPGAVRHSPVEAPAALAGLIQTFLDTVRL